ncbi:MAG: hypothetical protein HQL54_01200 [Magnetococcales bacterium]|nr:hypothetical protein [Magnetococcales bacterium]
MNPKDKEQKVPLSRATTGVPQPPGKATLLNRQRVRRRMRRKNGDEVGSKIHSRSGGSAGGRGGIIGFLLYGTMDAIIFSVVGLGMMVRGFFGLFSSVTEDDHTDELEAAWQEAGLETGEIDHQNPQGGVAPVEREVRIGPDGLEDIGIKTWDEELTDLEKELIDGEGIIKPIIEGGLHNQKIKGLLQEEDGLPEEELIDQAGALRLALKEGSPPEETTDA